MQENKAFIGGVLLIIGIAVGYGIRGAGDAPVPVPAVVEHGSHVMADGTVMADTAPSMSMTEMMADMNAQLKGKDGDAFDKAFLEEMIVHHEGAVDMAKLALTHAKHAEIKDLATAIITAQESEIKMMRGWMTGWYSK